MKTTGVVLGLTTEGGLELNGLERLDDELYARVLEVARANKADLVAELQTNTAALFRFEHKPRGVVEWLADPVKHAGRNPAHSPRWRACVRAEACALLSEVAE